MTDEEIALEVEKYRTLYFEGSITANEYIGKLLQLICSSVDSDDIH